MTTETSDVSDALIGGNASAEGGGDEGAEASSVSGCDIVLANRLASVSFANKKEYQTYLKVYSPYFIFAFDLTVTLLLENAQ